MNDPTTWPDVVGLAVLMVPACIMIWRMMD